jgi:Protein of unknown function (DUF2637)
MRRDRATDVVIGSDATPDVRRGAEGVGRTSATSADTAAGVRTVRVCAFIGVAALTGLGWTLSYAGLRELAHGHGMPEWAATLWPACVDVVVLVATLVALNAGRRSHVRRYAWALVILYSAGTVAGNAAVADPDLVAQIVHATPAITMVLSWHLFSLLVAGEERTTSEQSDKGREVTSDESPPADHRVPRDPLGARRSPTEAELVAAILSIRDGGRPVTGRALAATFGVSDRHGQRLLARVGRSAWGA